MTWFYQWLKTSQAKQVFGLCRWLHLYISAVLFSLLIFFCLTGITLNNPQWNSRAETQLHTLTIPNTLLPLLLTQDEWPVQSIQALLKTELGLSRPKAIDLSYENQELSYDYALPAGYAFATVLIDEGIIEVEYQQGNLLSLINDLHKGRYSGAVWHWLIDISAALMLLFAFSGLVILLQNAKHRRRCAIALTLGTVLPVLCYGLWVPRLTL